MTSQGLGRVRCLQRRGFGLCVPHILWGLTSPAEGICEPRGLHVRSGPVQATWCSLFPAAPSVGPAAVS